LYRLLQSRGEDVVKVCVSRGDYTPYTEAALKAFEESKKKTRTISSISVDDDDEPRVKLAKMTTLEHSLFTSAALLTSRSAVPTLAAKTANVPVSAVTSSSSTSSASSHNSFSLPFRVIPAPVVSFVSDDASTRDSADEVQAEEEEEEPEHNAPGVRPAGNLIGGTSTDPIVLDDD
jgi:hypothetical protein